MIAWFEAPDSTSTSVESYTLVLTSSPYEDVEIPVFHEQVTPDTPLSIGTRIEPKVFCMERRTEKACGPVFHAEGFRALRPSLTAAKPSTLLGNLQVTLDGSPEAGLTERSALPGGEP